MQKVFITGITGFLGSHLAKKMFEAGWFVAGNDNFIGSDKSNLHGFVEFYEIDCCDLEEMQKALAGSDLDFIARQQRMKAYQFSHHHSLRETTMRLPSQPSQPQ